MPFLVRWPGKVEPGVRDALVSQVDFPASLTALAGGAGPAGEAADSHNALPALLGQDKAGRESLVEQGGGHQIALRKGQWKFIPAGDAAGLNAGRAGKGAGVQLYDLATDPGETKNVAGEQRAKADELQGLLEKERGSAEAAPARD